MDIEKKHTQCGSYSIIKTLGSGYHAKVKLALGSNGQHYAIKVFKNNHALAANIKALANEIKIMQQMNHPNLVNIIEFNESMPYLKKTGKKDSRVCIVLELAQGGELFEYVASTGKFSEETSRFYFRQLMEALQYMHGRGIAHRDLKPENLLFDSNFNLKVADFGFSAMLDKYGDGKLRTVLGTEGYMAPEIHAKQPYDGKQVDLFAAGIILFIMFAGSPPFSKAAPNDPYYKLLASNKNETFWKFHAKHKGNPNFFSEPFRHLLDGIFQTDPAKRPTIEQVLQHPWLLGQQNQDILGEFKKRQEMVNAELEKERLKKQAEKQKQGPSNALYTGVGKFRSLDDIKQDYSEIETLWHLNDTKREIEAYDVQFYHYRKQSSSQLNDFFTTINQEFLLRYLLKEYPTYCNEVVKVSADKFKFQIRSVTEGQTVDLNIEFRQSDDLVNVNFSKKEGDSLKYHEKVTQIKALIQKAAQ